MAETATLESVLAVVRRVRPRERTVRPEERFREDLGMDDLDVTELVMDAEVALRVSLPAEAEDAATPAALAEWVDAARLGARRAGRASRGGHPGVGVVLGARAVGDHQEAPAGLNLAALSAAGPSGSGADSGD